MTSFVITIVCCVGILIGLVLQMNRGFITLIRQRVDRQSRPVAFWSWGVLVAVTVVAVAASSAWLSVHESGAVE